MSDFSIEGGGPHQYSSQEIQQYKERYEDSLHLFQQSFHDYQQPNIESHKQTQLKKVMDEALQVMNETASVALSKAKQKDEQHFNDTYKSFIGNPEDQQQQQRVQHELNQLLESE